MNFKYIIISSLILFSLNKLQSQNLLELEADFDYAIDRFNQEMLNNTLPINNSIDTNQSQLLHSL